MSSVERKIRSFPSESLEYTFLSRRANKAFSRFPNNTKEDQRVFGRCENFFGQALKGHEAVRSLRITATSADDTRVYSSWALETLKRLPPQITQIEAEEDVQEGVLTLLKDFRNTLGTLQDPNVANDIEPKKIEDLKAFFAQMGEIARNADIEPIDRVNIRDFG